MDNCRSYHYFAPHLQQRVTTMLGHDDTTTTTNMEIAAIDLPGHGWSSHKSSDAPPVHITDYVYYLAEAISQLPWSTTTTATSTNGSTNGEHEMHDHESNGAENDDQDNSNHGIVLVGHSMGAAICCMYAAAFPEQVDKLVLLEGGTFHSGSNDILQNIYIYIKSNLFCYFGFPFPPHQPSSRTDDTSRSRIYQTFARKYSATS